MMKWRIDSKCWLVVGAAFLWGCPIDDARFKESGSSSGGSESSSSGSGGGAGGNGGAAGMGGGSSSSGGMAGAGGQGVCTEPGTLGSCGTAACAMPCPKLIAVATGTTDGIAGTFESPKGWTTAPILKMKSDHPPAFAIRPGKNDGVALFRNTAGGGSMNNLTYATWNGNGFSAVTAVDAGNAHVDFSPVVTASADAVHVGFRDIASSTNEYHYAAFDGTAFNPTNEIVKDDASTSLGLCAPGMVLLDSSLILLNPGHGDEGLYHRVRTLGPLGTWDTGNKLDTIPMQFLVDDVTPAIVALNSGPELLVVLTEKATNKPLFSLTRTGGTWSNPVPIQGTSSIEIALLALPSGGAIMAYRDFVTDAISWSRFDGNGWSGVKEIGTGVKGKSKPALALGAGDAEAELLFVDAAGNAQHARLHKGAADFTLPMTITGATSLIGVAAATNL